MWSSRLGGAGGVGGTNLELPVLFAISVFAYSFSNVFSKVFELSLNKYDCAVFLKSSVLQSFVIVLMSSVNVSIELSLLFTLIVLFFISITRGFLLLRFAPSIN